MVSMASLGKTYICKLVMHIESRTQIPACLPRVGSINPKSKQCIYTLLIMGIIEQKHSSHFIERIECFDP